jgi:hypothetical protein
MEVALVTCSEWPRLSHSDSFLQRALVARGIDACPLAWNDPTVDWSRPLVSVIRSTWDYYSQHAAFLEWAQRVSQVHALWNPFPLLQWSSHKGYLRDLEEQDVPIIPTLWLMQGSSANLEQLMQEHNWSEVVIKPAVSGNAYGTILVKEEMVATEGQLYLDHMLSIHDMLIQPFLPAVLSSRERSLIFIDGEVTHAILRPPVRAMSRYQASCPDAADLSMSKEELVIPQEEELRLAHKIVDMLPSSVLFARIDLVHDVDGQLRLMEVESVEPRLWLELAPAAVERFADAIAREVKQARDMRQGRIHPQQIYTER